MKNSKEIIKIIIIIICLAIIMSAAFLLFKILSLNNKTVINIFKKQEQNSSEINFKADGVVAKILDPITIQLTDGKIIRYIGVKPPDTTTEVHCYGKEALLLNESIIGKEVRLEEEPLLTVSSDGALTRYVFIEGPKEIFINEKILEGGFGFPVVSKEMKYGERMISASRYSSATGKGLWSKCKVDSKKTPQGVVFSTEKITECVIKGKVSADGKKIYRTPDCPAYKETLVIQKDGGKWFCAEDTAKDEGFIKGEDCGK